MKEMSKSLLIGDNYESKADGTLVYKEPLKSKDMGEVVGIEEVPLANHTPILQKQRIVDNGIEPVETLVFNVRRAGRMWGDVSVTLKEILSQTPNIKFGAACRLFVGRGIKARYSEAMQIQCENAPLETLYTHTGYTMINGERVFLNGGYSVTANGLTDKYTVQLEGKLGRYGFTKERHDTRYTTLLTDLPKVAPKSLILTGLAYSFLTPLNAMLRDAGCEPRFILYFVGKTGTRKSTMANLFLSFFGKFREIETAPTSFKDTPNSIELALALLDSTLTLLDDRTPPTNKSENDQQNRIEQSVARGIGDRAGRARLNADSTLKTVYRPAGNLIVTAEEAFNNVGESAVARSVCCELKPDDVNLSALTEVQRKAGELNECMSEYIQFVLANWDSISEECLEQFYSLRDKAQTGGHGRLAVAVAHLQIAINVMCRWLESQKVISAEQSEEIKSQSWETFMELAAAQNRRICEEKPVKLFLDAVREMRDRGTIRICDMDKIGNWSSSNIIGYRDKMFYYFYPDAIYSEVRNFYMGQDKNFPLGKTALFRQLAIDGLIETDKGQNTKVKRLKDGKRPRFLWLNVTALDNEREGDG